MSYCVPTGLSIYWHCSFGPLRHDRKMNFFFVRVLQKDALSILQTRLALLCSAPASALASNFCLLSPRITFVTYCVLSFFSYRGHNPVLGFFVGEHVCIFSFSLFSQERGSWPPFLTLHFFPFPSKN
jgi:hypothetical protein